MDTHRRQSDPIDAAIAAVNEPPPEQHRQVTVTLSSTGRHVGISFPVDLTDSEALEFMGWMGTNLRLALEQERAQRPASRLVVPAGVLRQ